jgi:Putative zinc-finger
MNTNDCKRARRLLPLYAAGDADARRARAVAAHLEACAECRRLSEDFAASREMLREACEPPQFGADFYEQIRTGVLERIGRDDHPATDRRAPALAGLLDLLAGRRLALAASLALFVAACGLGYLYLRNNQRGVERQLAHADQSEPAAAPSPAREATPAGTPGAESGLQDRMNGASLSPNGAAQLARDAMRSPEDARDKQQEEARDERDAPRRGGPRRKQELAAGQFRRTPTLPRLASGRQPREAAQPQAAGVQTPRRVMPREAVPPTASASEVARIEIQTADPSIRIIWLAPGAAGESGPGRAEPKR